MSRSYDDYVAGRDKTQQSTTQVPAGQFGSTQQTLATGQPTGQTFDHQYGNQNIGTAVTSDRPYDPSRTESFGVTPSGLKSGQDAHKWSEQAIADIQHVEVQTPLPSELDSKYNRFDEQTKSSSYSDTQTGSGKPQTTYESVKNTASSYLPSTGGSQGESTYDRANDTFSSKLPSTGGSQGESTYDRAKNTASSAMPNTTNEKGETLYERTKNTVASALPSTGQSSTNTRGTDTTSTTGTTGQSVLDTLKSVGNATYQAAANVAAQGTQYMQQSVADAHAVEANKPNNSGYSRSPGDTAIATDADKTAHKPSDQSSFANPAFANASSVPTQKPTATDLSSSNFRAAQETYDDSPLGSIPRKPVPDSSETNPFRTGQDPHGQTAFGSVGQQNTTSAPSADAFRTADKIFDQSRQENQGGAETSSFGRPQVQSQASTESVDVSKKVPGGW